LRNHSPICSSSSSTSIWLRRHLSRSMLRRFSRARLVWRSGVHCEADCDLSLLPLHIRGGRRKAICSFSFSLIHAPGIRCRLICTFSSSLIRVSGICCLLICTPSDSWHLTQRYGRLSNFWHLKQRYSAGAWCCVPVRALGIFDVSSASNIASNAVVGDCGVMVICCWAWRALWYSA
jgi:hypothetical protein